MHRDLVKKSIKIQSKDNSQTVRNNYVLAIAIDSYRHWPILKNPVLDLYTITEILVKRYYFHKEKIIFLINEEATEKNILLELEKLAKLLTNNDNLLLFFSGHGHFHKEIELGFWIPVNAKLDDPSTYISNANIKHLVSRINSHHTILIVDSCFSGTLLSRKRNAPRSENFPSKKVFASGREEVVEDGAPGMHSPFAKGIINFLSSNNQKVSKLRTLIEYVKDFVEKNTTQSPMDGSLPNDGNGEFIFYQRLNEEDAWTLAKKQDKIDAYEQLLADFPNGYYSSLATDRIKYLKEDENYWRSIKENKSIDDCLEYIRKYPHGKYLVVAKQMIEKLKQENEIDQKNQEEINAQLSKIEKAKSKYVNTYYDAERLYKVGKFKEAMKMFQLAKTFYIPSKKFLPTAEELEKKIEACSTEIEFARLCSQGETAFNLENYSLARKIFIEALKIKPNDFRLKSLNRQCEIKLNQKFSEPASRKGEIIINSSSKDKPKNPPPPKPAPESLLWGRPLSFYIIWIFIIIVAIIVITSKFFSSSYIY